MLKRSCNFLILFLVISIISCNKNTSLEKINTSQTEIVEDLEEEDLKQILEYEREDNLIVYDNLRFGSGYNSSTLRETFNVMKYSNSNDDTEVTANLIGNTGSVEVKVLEDTRELRKTLKMTTNAALDLKYSDVLESKNKYNKTVYKETSVTDYTSKVAIHSQYVNEPIYYISPKMVDEYILLAKKDADSFMNKYGDMFVSKIYTGGEFVALMDIANTYSKDTTNVKEFISSANSFYGNKLSFDSEKQEATLKTNDIKILNVNFISRGGNLPEKLSLEGLKEHIKAFKTSVEGNQKPVVLYVELKGYESLPNFPNLDFSKIRIDQKDFLETSQNIIDHLQKNLDNIEFVLSKSKFFRVDDLAPIPQKKKEYKDILDNMEILVRRCRSDFNKCKIEKLPKMEAMEPYNPPVDYRYYFTKQKEIVSSLKSDGENGTLVYSEWDTIIDKTNPYFEKGQNTILIKGSLSSLYRPDKSPNPKAKCYPPVYKEERYIAGMTNIKVKGFMKTYHNHRDLWGVYSKPYYEIRIESTINGELLRQYNWEGNPIDIENNQKILIRLVNPKIKKIYHWSDAWRTKGIEKPRYYEVQACVDDPPGWKGTTRDSVKYYMKKPASMNKFRVTEASLFPSKLKKKFEFDRLEEIPEGMLKYNQNTKRWERDNDIIFNDK